MIAFLESLAPLAWTQLWQVTLVAAAALILARVVRRRHPHLAYGLLMLVMLKCLVPPLLSTPLSLLGRLPASPPQSAPVLLENAVLNQEAAGAAVVASRESVTTPIPAPNQPGVAPAVVPAQMVHWRGLLVALWIAGAVICACGFAAARARQRRAIHRWTTPADGELVALHRELCGRLGLWRPVRLLVSSAADGQPVFGPLSYGLLRPTVVLPASIVAGLDRSRIEPILAHELIHIRRGDSWAASAQVWAAAIWWFHPLVWWASRQVSRQREHCCDEAVLATTRCDAGRYAQELINILRLGAGGRRVSLGNGMQAVEVTRDRLEAILNRRGQARQRTPLFCWFVLAVGALLIIPGRGVISAPPPAGDSAGSEPAFAELSVEQFGRLDERGQLDYLKRAVLDFQKRTANISFTATEYARNVEFDRLANRIGTKLFVLGGVPQTTNRRTTNLWRIGDSFRWSLTQEPTMPKLETVSDPIILCSYDAKTREQRMFWGPQAERDRSSGSIITGPIDPENDPGAYGMFSCYVMCGRILESGGDVHGIFLEQFEKAKISQLDQKAGTVEVTYPEPNRPERIWRTVFDLSKRAMIVANRAGSVPGEGGKPFTGEGGLMEAINPVLVDGVWLPTQIRSKAADVHNPESDVSKHVTLFDCTITFAEIGKVKEADLKFEFPPGTEIERHHYDPDADAETEPN